MEDTPGRLTEKGSVSQDGQTCNMSSVQNRATYNTVITVWTIRMTKIRPMLFYVFSLVADWLSSLFLADGGDYLKEILPTFFVHQKMSLRRLRQILHRLPSEDKKKQGGTSGLNYSQLNVRINTWVTSATGKQIQQLPEILTQTGAISAGDKLQNKLRRINSRLNELCSLGNEVNVL